MKLFITKSKEEAWMWFRNILSDLDDREYVFTIKEYRKKRSNEQNSLYWAWMTCIAQETGHDKEDVHEAYKRKFLSWENKNLPGELSFWVPVHTPDCDTKEFTEYLNKIHQHAYHFFNISLPRPDDKIYEQFINKYRSNK